WLLTFWFVPVRAALAISTLQLFIVAGFTKKINQLHGKSDEKAKILHKYAEMIALIENQTWQSEKMKAVGQTFQGKKGNASKSLFTLTKLVEALDSRVNILGTIITNGLYMRDLKNAYGIEKWRENNKDQILIWFHSLAETEALASLATFSFNNPGFYFPQIIDKDFLLEAEDLAHPLIKEKTRIGNQIIIDGKARIMLITGSNMAGKSTFLRAVGVNYVLAACGAPVCASRFSFTPISLFTSMRIGDSIKDSESTFYAELKRIKTIIEHLQEGKPLFILLDEILRGTNSGDKFTGSKALLKQLVALQGSGILATHDLGLAVLEDEHPQNIHNYHFDVNIEGDKFLFDYKLKRGVCNTMNATLLMQKMGIEFSDQLSINKEQ
ncbi:MAG: DNA mismatch repair protein MutS, partial [Sphingobacteriales bacterium]